MRIILYYIILYHMSSGFEAIVKLSSGVVGAKKKVTVTKPYYKTWAKKNTHILKKIDEIVKNQFQLLDIKTNLRRGTRSLRRGKRLGTRTGTRSRTRSSMRGGSRTSSQTVEDSFKTYIKLRMDWIAPFVIGVITMVIAVFIYNVSAVGYTIMGNTEKNLLNKQAKLAVADTNRVRAETYLAAELKNNPGYALKMEGDQQQTIVMIGCATLIIISTMLMSVYTYNRGEDRKLKKNANNSRLALEQEKMRTGEITIRAPIPAYSGYFANSVMGHQQQLGYGQQQFGYGQQQQQQQLGWQQ
jgi:hypothetical protein